MDPSYPIPQNPARLPRISSFPTLGTIDMVPLAVREAAPAGHSCYGFDRANTATEAVARMTKAPNMATIGHSPACAKYPGLTMAV